MVESILAVRARLVPCTGHTNDVALDLLVEGVRLLMNAFSVERVVQRPSLSMVPRILPSVRGADRGAESPSYGVDGLMARSSRVQAIVTIHHQGMRGLGVEVDMTISLLVHCGHHHIVCIWALQALERDNSVFGVLRIDP